MNEENKLVNWLKEHKKELAITGITTVAVLVVALGVKNKDSLIKNKDILHKMVKQTPQNIQKISINASLDEAPHIEVGNVEKMPFEVSPHIRNLHKGWSASQDKVEAALEHGFVLNEGQTWVESYKKCLVA